MTTKLEPKIDELYALPLDAFTHARNALAKTLSGNDKKVIASLVKPSVAMWVVNQLYWQDAPTYKALVDASDKLRTAHRAALKGRKVDTSKPDELHRTTLEKAFAKLPPWLRNMECRSPTLCATPFAARSPRCRPMKRQAALRASRGPWASAS